MENSASLFGIPHLVSWIVLIPFIGMVIVACLRHVEIIRWTTLGISLIMLGLTVSLWASFDYTVGGVQFVDRVPFPLGFFEYAVGVDGISLPLVLLTAFLIPLCVLVSWRIDNTKAFMMLILLAELAVTGVFTALDAFLFLLFWEAAMIPMYFVIAFWGGPKRVQAAIKFLLFSVGGSLLLSLGIEALHHFGHTFYLPDLMQMEYAPKVQVWIFLALFVGFAIKVPMLPVHGWIADAHGEAPTAGSVILSGLLLKMGAYGLIRFCLSMLPEASASFALLIQWLSVLAILYGGAMALAQPDFKRLIAYSSIAHMGFVTLGIFGFNNQSIEGAVLQMVNHGLTTGALFLVAGMLYDRTHDRTINNYGGLHQVMPRFAVVLSIFTVASFGLPGTGNFIGEFLVLFGTSFHGYTLVLLVLVGIVLGAAYMLSMFQRLVLNPISPLSATLVDLTRREIVCVIPLALAVFIIGLYPTIILDLMQATVTTIVQDFAQVQTLRIVELLGEGGR
ncbi:MAG: NADH-quinone oxidoreductase subunit M [Nitrospira sp.]|nr:NADH-quinone oxidoreductase subunit M [Nitrospira sp.]